MLRVRSLLFELVWRRLSVWAGGDHPQQRILDWSSWFARVVVARQGRMAAAHNPITRPTWAFLSLMQPAPTAQPVRVLPESVDRRLYTLIHGLPHSPVGDRYVTILSDLGEGLGWVAAGGALAWLGGPKGRRAGLATVIASLGTTYLVQQRIKPIFRRKRPHVGREILVVGIRTTDASFPSGHAASSFAAATALAVFYPKTAPLVYALATGVGASRVHLGHHFPSDVIVGAGIGAIAGGVVAALVKAARA